MNIHGVNMESILSALSLTVPVSVNALQKVTGLGATALTMALVGLGGQIVAIPEGLLLAPDASVTKTVGPRGPTAKTKPRQEACREALMALAGAPGGVNAKDLLLVAEDRFVYTDILLVARELTEAGLITENKKGRKATWTAAVEG
jgi:hypothetical protein